MASLNKFQGIGNLGRDPEVRYAPSGDAFANISIGISEKWKDKATGEPREHTEWVRVVFSGRLAEIAGEYLRKGSQVYVEGSLRTRKWADKDGQEKYSTEVRADQMQMLGSRQGDGQQGGNAPRQQGAAPQQRAPQQPAHQRPAPAGGGSGFDDFSDDIPFITASPMFDMVPSKARRMGRYR